jgi:hypothetical protein
VERCAPVGSRSVSDSYLNVEVNNNNNSNNNNNNKE